MDDGDPCSEQAMRAEIRANARGERALLGIGLVAVALTAIAVVVRDLVA